MLIPSPRDIKAEIRRVRDGEMLTQRDLRHRLAAKLPGGPDRIRELRKPVS